MVRVIGRGVVGAVLLALAGCISTGGGGTPVVTPPPPQVVAVQVFEFTAPSVTVPGVRVVCNGTERGFTNGDGYLESSALTGEHFECLLSKDGYGETVAAFRPQPQGPGCPTCGTLRASLTALQPPEPEVPVTPAPIVGRLRLNGAGTAFVDDSGFVLPLYAHSGDLFSVYVRDPARALGVLDRIAQAGYHGVRTWFTLGCGQATATGCRTGDYWYGREVGEDVTPDYWSRVRSFFEAAQARKLRIGASQGDVTQIRNRQSYMQRLRQTADAVPVIDWLDCGNEAHITGEPDPARLAQCVSFYGNGGALRTLTDAPIYGQGVPAAEMFDRFSVPPADLFEIHSFRGGHSWDKRRHIWGYTYCGEGCPKLKTGIGTEPPGNGSRVSAIENRHELDDEGSALLALGSMLGRQAYVWFSGEGVILDAGLQGEAGFYSNPRAVALLPRDVMTYETSMHSGGTFASRRVLEPVGEVRVDGRMAADGRFAFTIDGPAGTWRLRVARSFSGQLCHPGTGQCEPVVRAAGETLDVSFTRGRLLTGRVQ